MKGLVMPMNWMSRFNPYFEVLVKVTKEFKWFKKKL